MIVRERQGKREKERERERAIVCLLGNDVEESKLMSSSGQQHSNEF